MYLRDIYNKNGKKIENDQEFVRSYPISCLQNQKGKTHTHNPTHVHETHAQYTELTANYQTAHSATYLKTSTTCIFTYFQFQITCQNKTEWSAAMLETTDK